ncbi:hypothetical protein RHOSPDRAFT_34269 [Rhodotorula sp. JG-1b]|nr:hypothetical protein RHOSPDRAFT_34269 [Rhodotorula sp. JG-1b]
MSSIKSENWDMDWLMPPAPPVRKSGSRSTSSSSASSPDHSRGGQGPSTTPELAIAVEEEEEQASLVRRSSASKKRSLAPQPPDHDDDENEKVQRNVKVKRSQSPSVAIKFEPDSDEEDKLKVLREEEEKKFKWPRPAAMQGVNLSRLEDLDARGAPFVVPPGSELDVGLQRMLEQADGSFERCDLFGPRQETNWELRSTRPARYKLDRATYNSKGNLACRAPGPAILALQHVYSAEREDRIAVGGWEKQEEVPRRNSFYAKSSKNKRVTSYGDEIFEGTLIGDGKGKNVIGLDKDKSRQMSDIEKQQIHAAIGRRNRVRGRRGRLKARIRSLLIALGKREYM